MKADNSAKELKSNELKNDKNSFYQMNNFQLTVTSHHFKWLKSNRVKRINM